MALALVSAEVCQVLQGCRQITYPVGPGFPHLYGVMMLGYLWRLPMRSTIWVIGVAAKGIWSDISLGSFIMRVTEAVLSRFPWGCRGGEGLVASPSVISDKMIQGISRDSHLLQIHISVHPASPAELGESWGALVLMRTGACKCFLPGGLFGLVLSLHI